jgi:signal transduction histidine kinase
MDTTPEIIIEFVLPVLGILFFIGIGVVALNFSFQNNLRNQILEKEELKARYQKELLRSMIESQEEERKRIAIDIHDEIGALLNTSRFNVTQLGLTAKTPENQKLFEDIYSLYGKISQNLRRIAHDLRPVVLEKFGLVAALEGLEEDLEASGLQFWVQSSLQTKLPDKLELALYRIIQELISNTLKHAQATQISIRLEELPDGFQLFYEDNGIGFSPGTTSSGLGLRSIESRLSIFGGQATFMPVQKGVLVQIELNKESILNDDSGSTG